MLSRLRQYFGSYAGSESTHKRKTPYTSPQSVDQELGPYKRKIAIENARDLDKNFSIAAWAVRKHLDYVSAFNFEPNNGDSDLDEQLRQLVKSYSLPDNCHVGRRHSLSDMLRLAEAARTIDGDMLFVKLQSGHLQAVEGDRIANPPQSNLSHDELPQWVNGVKVTKAGKARAYGVHSRTRRGLEWEREIRASNVLHHGYFQRFDQVRGVSPLMSALDTFRDVYEGFDYALAKAKLTQLFGLVINTNGQDEVGEHELIGDGKYEVKVGEGPFKLELDQDETASFLESGSPPMELQTFTTQMVGVALKSLDIPFSFYDESFTNFFGSRSAFIHYKKACRQKIQQNQKLLDDITRWRLSGFLLSGELQLPSGVGVNDLSWEWVPEGTPWWNPAQEVTAAVMELKAGLNTRKRIVKEKWGLDWESDILPQLQLEEEQLLSTRGYLYDETEMKDSIDE